MSTNVVLERYFVDVKSKEEKDYFKVQGKYEWQHSLTLGSILLRLDLLTQNSLIL